MSAPFVLSYFDCFSLQHNDHKIFDHVHRYGHTYVLFLSASLPPSVASEGLGANSSRVTVQSRRVTDHFHNLTTFVVFRVAVALFDPKCQFVQNGFKLSTHTRDKSRERRNPRKSEMTTYMLVQNTTLLTQLILEMISQIVTRRQDTQRPVSLL